MVTDTENVIISAIFARFHLKNLWTVKMEKVNDEIRQLAKDIIECPELINNQVDNDLHAVSSLLWKIVKTIDVILEAKKNKEELFRFMEE